MKKIPDYFVISREFSLTEDGSWKSVGRKNSEQHRTNDLDEAVAWMQQRCLEAQGIWLYCKGSLLSVKSPGSVELRPLNQCLA